MTKENNEDLDLETGEIDKLSEEGIEMPTDSMEEDMVAPAKDEAEENSTAPEKEIEESVE